jgi:hypothetical protein
VGITAIPVHGVPTVGLGLGLGLGMGMGVILYHPRSPGIHPRLHCLIILHFHPVLDGLEPARLIRNMRDRIVGIPHRPEVLNGDMLDMRFESRVGTAR